MLEAITKLAAVNLKNPSWPQSSMKKMVAYTKINGWGVEDIAKDTVPEFLPILIDPMKQHTKLLDHPLCFFQHSLNLDPGLHDLLNINSVGAPLKPFNLLSPALNCDAVSTNPAFDQIDKIGESPLAE